METTDEIIEKLLAKVEEKKKNVVVISNPQYKTNMSLCFELTKGTMSTIYNLHVLDEMSLLFVLSKLEAMEASFEQTKSKHNLDIPFKLHGYDFSEWKDDIILKLSLLSSKRKLSELKETETRLNNLMSSEKKEYMELIKIARLIDNVL